MSSQERIIRPNWQAFGEGEVYAVRLANKIERSNREYTNIDAALQRLQQQRPSVGGLIENPWGLVKRKNVFLGYPVAAAERALGEDNYIDALTSVNTIHPYAVLDYWDALEGEAFDLSLGVHRKFAKKLFHKFGDASPFLITQGDALQGALEDTQILNDRWREYELQRLVIHQIALEGKFGPEALEHIDPYALITVE